MRLGSRTGLCAWRSLEKLPEILGRALPRRDLQQGADENPDHVPHESVGFDPEFEQVTVPVPLRSKHFAFEADVLGLGWRECCEVVGSKQRVATRSQQLVIEFAGPPQRPAPLE